MNVENLNLIFLYIALAQAIFAIGYLMIYKQLKFSTTLFVLFLTAYISPTIDHIIISSGVVAEQPRFFYTPTGFYYFLAPLFYLYTKSLLKFVASREIILFCLFGIVEFIFMVTMFALPEKYSTAFRIEHTSLFVNVYGFGLPLFSIIILFLILRIITNYQKKYLDIFSNIQSINLNWLKYTTILLLISYVFQLATLSAFLSEHHRETIFMLDSLLSLVFLYWITIYGIRQSHIPKDFQIFEKNTPDTISSSSEYEFEILKSYLEENKSYKNTNLTVVELAEMVHMHPKKVSATINEFSKNNFNQFINLYRIKEAKELLLDPEYNNFTIEAIAQESGFKSKSVFNTFFKSVTGKTPTSFRTETLNPSVSSSE